MVDLSSAFSLSGLTKSVEKQIIPFFNEKKAGPRSHDALKGDYSISQWVKSSHNFGLK